MDNNERPLTAEEKAARREELHQQLEEMYIKRHGHPRPEPQIEHVTEHVTDDGRPFKYVAYDNDMGELYDTPPSEEEKQARIDKLCIKMDWLATEYFFGYIWDDGKEIVNTFREYFELTKDDTKVDKRVLGDALYIIEIYYRGCNDIKPEYSYDAANMHMYLCSSIDSWGSNAVSDRLEGNLYLEHEFEEDEPYFRKKYEEFKADYKSRQEKREWVRNLKPTE